MNKTKKNSKELLSIKDLTIAYGHNANNVAVNEANLTVNKGDFFGIVGESGSGKTSLGKSVIRLVIPSSGEIKIDGRVISDKKISRADRHWLNKSVQMIFQNPSGSMNPIRTILQTVSEPLTTNPALIKDSIEYIHSIQAIRKYCKYEFSMKHFELYWGFQMDYLTKIKAKYARLYSEIKTVEGDTARSSNELYEELDRLLQSFIEDRLKDLNDVYAFARSNKNLADEQVSRCTKGQLSDIDLVLHDAIELKKTQKINARYSHEAQRKQHDIDKFKNLVRFVKSNFKTKRAYPTRAIIENWKSTIKVNLKKFSSAAHLSKNDFSFAINKIELIKQRHLLCYWKVVNKLKVLNPKLLEKTITYIEKCADEIYAPVLADALYFEKNEKLSKEEVKHSFAWVRRFKSMSAKINRYLIWHRAKKPVDIAPIVLDTLNCQKLVDHNRPFDPKDFYFLINTNRAKIEQVIEELRNNQSNLYKKRDHNIKELNKKLVEWKKELKKINESRNIFEELKAKWAFIRSKKHLRQVKRERRAYLKNFFMKKWAMFKHNKRKVNAQINKLAQSVLRLHIDCIERSNRIIKSLFKHEIRKEAKKEQISLYRSIKTKLERIDLLDREYNALVKGTRLYWRLFRWKFFFPWLLLRRIVRKRMQESVFEMLKLVGLRYEHAFRYPHEFSGGQKQRIVIARALIAKPKILIADEPISALDVSIQAQIINVMKNLNKKLGVTFLFIAHDLSVVRYVCNKTTIMHHGRTLERGDTNEIFTNPIHPYTKSLLAAAPKLSRIHVDLSNFSEKSDYELEYSVDNVPTFNQVPGDKNHEVLSTPSQFKKWCNLSIKK